MVGEGWGWGGVGWVTGGGGRVGEGGVGWRGRARQGTGSNEGIVKTKPHLRHLSPTPPNGDAYSTGCTACGGLNEMFISESQGGTFTPAAMNCENT